MICYREQLLLVMLRITSGVLSKKPPENMTSSKEGKLAQALFQVNHRKQLFVSFIFSFYNFSRLVCGGGGGSFNND